VGSGWVQLSPLVVCWVGLGQSADELGWIRSHKMDPRTTLKSICHKKIHLSDRAWFASSARMRPFPTRVTRSVVFALGVQLNCAETDEPIKVPLGGDTAGPKEPTVIVLGGGCRSAQAKGHFQPFLCSVRVPERTTQLIRFVCLFTSYASPLIPFLHFSSLISSLTYLFL